MPRSHFQSIHKFVPVLVYSLFFKYEQTQSDGFCLRRGLIYYSILSLPSLLLLHFLFFCIDSISREKQERGKLAEEGVRRVTVWMNKKQGRVVLVHTHMHEGNDESLPTCDLFFSAGGKSGKSLSCSTLFIPSEHPMCVCVPESLSMNFSVYSLKWI